MSFREKDKDELREEALRPSLWLGYDRDSVAVHLVSREAYEIAESQLRRAIYLNPYERRFKRHLAWCLYKMGRYTEAKEWAEKALAQAPDAPDARRLLEVIARRLDGRAPDI